MRYGYRRVHVVLRREGWMTNIKRTYRLYRAMRLKLRNKTPRRRVKAKLREDRSAAPRPNETWAMDFVHDQLATGRKLRVLTVVDIFSKFAPVSNRCLRPTGFSAGRELSAYSVAFAGYLFCIQYSLMARTASGMW